MNKLFAFYHFVATTNEDSNCLWIGALFNDEHSVFGCAKTKFLDNTGKAQLLGSQFFEARDNTTASSDGNQLDLGTTDPTDSGQLSLEQHVVGFVVKAPLTNCQTSTRIFNLLIAVKVEYAKMLKIIIEILPAEPFARTFLPRTFSSSCNLQRWWHPTCAWSLAWGVRTDKWE